MKKFHKALKKFIKEFEQKSKHLKKRSLSLHVKSVSPEYFLTQSHIDFEAFVGKQMDETSHNLFEESELSSKIIFTNMEDHLDLVWKYFHSMYVYAFYDTHTSKSEVETFLQKYGREEVPNFVSNEWKNLSRVYKELYGRKEAEKTVAPLTLPNGTGMIHNLASEIAQDLQHDDSFKNMLQSGGSKQDMLTSLLSGGNNELLQKMFSTVSGKINDKIDKDELDESAMMSEATSMLSSFESNPMMSSMMKNILQSQLTQPSRPTQPQSSQHPQISELPPALLTKYDKKA